MNQPSIIVSPTQILGHYNYHHKDDKKERVVDSVKEWYIERAKKEGWKKATFHGSECLLEVSVSIDE